MTSCSSRSFYFFSYTLKVCENKRVQKIQENGEILASRAAGVIIRNGLIESGTQRDRIMISCGEEIGNIIIALTY